MIDSHTTELERKQYLVTTVIPSRGYYRGMMLLRRVLIKSKQFDLYKSLKLAYDEAVNPVYGEKLKLLQKPEVEHETSEDEGKRPTSISSCSSDDSDDDILLASPVEQLSMSSYVNVASPVEQLSVSSYDVDTEVPTFVVISSPHHQRSGYISYQLHPYRVPPRQAESVTNYVPDNSGASDHDKVPVTADGSGTLQSVDWLVSDSPVMKLVFVGDTFTGKTSLLQRYVNNKFSIAVEPTILVDFKSVELTCCNVKYKLHLWDTAGQERFNAIAKVYYRDAVGGFVVYDVTKRISFEHCLQWKEEIDRAVCLENGDPIPIVLIANKVDCGKLDGKQFSKKHGFAGYFETSAKTGAGIKEAIHFMVKKIHQLSYANQEPVQVQSLAGVVL